MTSESIEVLLAVALVYAAAGAIKGLLGLGLPTLAVGLTAQFLDAREAVALVICPMLAANAWQVARSGAPRAVVVGTWRRYRPLAASMLVVIGVVSLLAPQVPGAWVAGTLGVVVTLFAATSLWREPPPLPAHLDVPAQLAAGTVAGVIGGIAGIWAPPIIVYLGTLGLDREAFVETVGVLLFVGCVVLLAGYLANGLLEPATAVRSLWLIPPAIAGFAVGERYRRRLSGPRFRTLVLGFFLIMGLNLVRRALTGAP